MSVFGPGFYDDASSGGTRVIYVNGGASSGIQWKGTYDAQTAYNPNDMLKYNGSIYFCIRSATNVLPTDATYFTQLVADGATATYQGNWAAQAYSYMSTVTYTTNGNLYICTDANGALAADVPSVSSKWTLMVSGMTAAEKTNITNHMASTSNPHTTTHAQLSDKGTATHAQLDLIASQVLAIEDVLHHREGWKYWVDTFNTLDTSIWTCDTTNASYTVQQGGGLKVLCLSQPSSTSQTSMVAPSKTIDITKPFIYDFRSKRSASVAGHQWTNGLYPVGNPTNVYAIRFYMSSALYYSYNNSSTGYSGPLSASLSPGEDYVIYRIEGDGTNIYMRVKMDSLYKWTTVATLPLSTISYSSTALWYPYVVNDTTAATPIESWIDQIVLGQQDNHTTNTSNPHATTHAQLSDKGTNTHAQIDAFIANSSLSPSWTTEYVELSEFHTLPSTWSEYKPSVGTFTYDAVGSGKCTIALPSTGVGPIGIKRTQNFIDPTKDWQVAFRVKPTVCSQATGEWIVGMADPSNTATWTTNHVAIESTWNGSISKYSLKLRAAAAGASVSDDQGFSHNLNEWMWLRITKAGTSVTAQASGDGITWYSVGTLTSAHIGSLTLSPLILLGEAGYTQDVTLDVDTVRIACSR